MTDVPQLTLHQKLAALLNEHNAENGSDTPDYILAQYLLGCLNSLEVAVRARDSWHGNVPCPVPPVVSRVGP